MFHKKSSLLLIPSLQLITKNHHKLITATQLTLAHPENSEKNPVVAPGDVPTKTSKNLMFTLPPINHGSWGSLLGLVSFRVIFHRLQLVSVEIFPPRRSSWTPTLWDAIGSCSTWRWKKTRHLTTPKRMFVHAAGCFLQTLQREIFIYIHTHTNQCVLSTMSQSTHSKCRIVFSLISNAFFLCATGILILELRCWLFWFWCVKSSGFK